MRSPDEEVYLKYEGGVYGLGTKGAFDAVLIPICRYIWE